MPGYRLNFHTDTLVEPGRARSRVYIDTAVPALRVYLHGADERNLERPVHLSNFHLPEWLTKEQIEGALRQESVSELLDLLPTFGDPEQLSELLAMIANLVVIQACRGSLTGTVTSHDRLPSFRASEANRTITARPSDINQIAALLRPGDGMDLKAAVWDLFRLNRRLYEMTTEERRSEVEQLRSYLSLYSEVFRALLFARCGVNVVVDIS